MNEQPLPGQTNRLNLCQYDLNLPDAPMLYFFHIQKTAGSSLSLALTEHFWPVQTFPVRLWGDLLAIGAERLSEYRLLYGHFYNHIYHLLPYTPITITVLREPIARALSHYRHIWRATDDYFYNQIHRLGGLQAFLRDTDGRTLLSNFQTRMLAVELDVVALAKRPNLANRSALNRAIEMTTIADISDAELLARAKARLDSFASVGLAERLRESILLLDYLFGWWPVVKVPYENIAPPDQKPMGITMDAIDLLRELNALDIELYHYAEQRFNSDFAQMMTEMLEEHAATIHPSSYSKIIELDFDHQLPGTGWYPPERDAEGQLFRWLGPASQAAIALSLPTDRQITIFGYIAYGIMQDILNSLTLIVENTSVPLTLKTAGPYSYTFSGIIPIGAAATSRPTYLTFHVARTVSPRALDPQSTDERSLSLAFRCLRLSFASIEKW